MVLSSLLGLFSHDLAIDLGSANTLIYIKGKGVVCSEPSMVAVQKGEGGVRKVVAVGHQAKEMLGRTPADIEVVRPLKDGVITDFEIIEAMLRCLIRKVHHRRTLVRPRMAVCVPAEITEVERRAVREAAEGAGAREVHLIEGPMAAALGAGLAVTEASGHMVVDIGGGTTEVAVISLSGIVYSKSLRVAGDKIDEAIIEYLKNRYNLLVGERTAEQIKIDIGSAYPVGNIKSMEVKGRDLVEGVPKVMEINSEEIRDAIQPPIQEIVNAVKTALESTPPELAADIADKGIILTGGGALLSQLNILLREETGLPITLTEEPLHCIVYGTAKALEQLAEKENSAHN